LNNIFSNTKEAFSLKTNFELLRAQFLFKIIQNRTLVKVSTFLTNFALKFYLPVTPIIKMTVFNHFCGGVSELDCNPVIKKMYEKKVSSVLDFSTEAFNSEVEFDNCYDKKISIIEFIKHRPEIPFAVFKPTCLGSVDLFKKKTKGEDLNYEENLLWIKVVERFEGVCQKAHDNDIKILIDAEEVFVQKAIDDLALLMMLKFNRKKSIIFNTVQMYRWDRLEYLNNLLKDKSNKDVIFGFKLVRGAYMEKERLIAKSLNIKSPICSSKKETDINFNSGLDFIFKNLERISLVCASHNEDSVIKVMDFIKKRNIKFSDDKIWFGQLYGMSDNITFNLANMGYNSFKILPFGPVRNLMPYLIRRAEENTSVEGQTGRELQLIINEKNRRAIEKS
jgi:proline dehydrogenase|tara:strand:- start:51529 stop:52704 length:1176 start_codon:yes stop_codon:yes gene_type:complete